MTKKWIIHENNLFVRGALCASLIINEVKRFTTTQTDADVVTTHRPDIYTLSTCLFCFNKVFLFPFWTGVCNFAQNTS